MSKFSARAVRWFIWGLSALAAGAMKPIFFPAGGVAYAISALVLIGVFALLGIWIEHWLLAKHAKNRDGG